MFTNRIAIVFQASSLPRLFGQALKLLLKLKYTFHAVETVDQRRPLRVLYGFGASHRISCDLTKSIYLALRSTFEISNPKNWSTIRAIRRVTIIQYQRALLFLQLLTIVFFDRIEFGLCALSKSFNLQ